MQRLGLFNNIGECGPPVTGEDVVIHNYTTTFEGSSITFTCEDGLYPNVTITATCTGEGHWSPDPATYMCSNITGITTSTTTIYPASCPANCLKASDQIQSKILKYVANIV